jgi:hypothetical protein
LTYVEFQTPTGPAVPPVPVKVAAVLDVGAITISEVKMSDHKTDIYQPSDNGDHSKR